MFRLSRDYIEKILKTFLVLQCEPKRTAIVLHLLHVSFLDCPELNRTIENGHINGNGSTFGSSYSFHCDDGYTIEGQSTLVCDKRGQWNASMPVCSRGELINLELDIILVNSRQRVKNVKCYLSPDLLFCLPQCK